MTLALALAVGVLGAAWSGWALGRGGSAARGGAIGGLAALLLLGALVALSPSPATLAPDGQGAVPGTLWNGALAPGGYLRLVVILWSLASIALVLIAWLLRGTAGLRAVLPGSLAAIVGTIVALGASSAQLGLVAGAGAGLASVLAALGSPRVEAAGMAAREIRVAVGAALATLAVAAVVPVLARLILVNPDGPATGAQTGERAALAFGLLVVAAALAIRTGVVPWHRRISGLTDALAPTALPLVIAWAPLPLLAVAVGVTSDDIARLSPEAGAARGLIVAATLLATAAAALVAFIQDDLRHAVGYLTIADLGLVLLAVAALDPAAWGPARAWLLTVAVTKTALAGWSAVVEDRFETRSIPELRGWLRPAPVLGVGLALIVLASIGLPGWAVANDRASLTQLAASDPWRALLLLASLLTAPAYVRWLWLGVGAPTSRVDRVAPELSGLARLPTRRLAMLPPRRRETWLLVEQERSSPAPGAEGVRGAGARDAGPADVPPATPPSPAGVERQLAEAVARRRSAVLSGAVLALAMLATLVALGGFDLQAAAGEPVPAVPGITASGG